MDIYSFLGLQQNFFFFQHVTDNLNLNNSAQVINLLINENRIQKDQHVIIFEVNNEKIDVLYLTHCSNKLLNFQKDNLKSTYERLCDQPRNSIVFQILINSGKLYSFESEFNIRKFDYEIGEIHQITTNKPFMRLPEERKEDYDCFELLCDIIKEHKQHKDYDKIKDITISAFIVLQNLTICTLVEGDHTFLPKTDVIQFINKKGKKQKMFFNSFYVLYNMKTINVRNKEDVMYYDCDFFPTEEEFELMVPF